MLRGPATPLLTRLVKLYIILAGVLFLTMNLNQSAKYRNKAYQSVSPQVTPEPFQTVSTTSSDTVAVSNGKKVHILLTGQPFHS